MNTTTVVNDIIATHPRGRARRAAARAMGLHVHEINFRGGNLAPVPGVPTGGPGEWTQFRPSTAAPGDTIEHRGARFLVLSNYLFTGDEYFASVTKFSMVRV